MSAGPEGGELLVGVGDAAGPTALIPAARLLDEPAAPEREPLPGRERPRRKALQLDAARQAAQLRPLEAEQQRCIRLRPRRHNKQGCSAAPTLAAASRHS